jgi:cell division transport system ATP-binding protein
MVQFQNVTKGYSNGLVAVHEVSFSINEGEFVFLIGPSGSGKTTLIELLIRDLIPSSGKIYLQDTDITNISRRKIYKLRRQIGVIFQDYKLIEDKTAYENVAFAMEAAGKSRKEINETVPYVLEVVGLEDRMDSFPVQLSGGEQQRTAIARAIANNPKLLIADEPTGNLDPASAWDIVQVLTKINNWGTTVIMSTHGTDIVNTLNKRVIQMEGGVIVRDDDKGQYEFSSEKDQEEIKQEIEKNKKGEKKPSTSFKVKLPKEEVEDIDQEVSEEVKRPSLFTRFFGRSSSTEDELVDDETEEVTEVEEENTDEVEKTEVEEEGKRKGKKKDSKDSAEKSPTTGLASNRSKEEPKKKEAKLSKSMEKKLEEHSDMTVDYLHLPKTLIQELQNNGYETIGDIVEGGPEKLSQSIDIDSEEVIMIAKSLEKLVS